MKTAPCVWSADIDYDHPEMEPPGRFCTVGLRAYATEEEAERDILKTGEDYENQGYRILAVRRRRFCSACAGVGHIAKRPKGSRRKNLPAWALTRVECEACGGSGEYREPAN